jgi:alanine racemase
MSSSVSTLPLRPAWVEIDLAQLRRNLDIILADNQSRSPATQLISVLKDNAYGHGAVECARAIGGAAKFIALGTLEEAIALRDAGNDSPILLLGERHAEELACCIEHRLTPVTNDAETAAQFGRLAQARGIRAAVHVKINTGMSRFGLRWNEALPTIAAIARTPGIFLEGIMSHFAMSDEADKTFARQQLAHFRELLSQLDAAGIHIPLKHFCNSGGFLDLPEAHFDAVRIGIIHFGVYPSQVCRRIPGLEPVMSVKARIAAIQRLQPGDSVGYGMRYTATSERMIGVVPIGYGDGFPRVRNEGGVIIHGQRAPLIGGVSMDAITVDLTGVPGVQRWDEVTIMGRDGAEEITVHDLAALKRSVSYDVLCGWRSRLPRVFKS